MGSVTIGDISEHLRTSQRVVFADCRNMDQIQDESVHLVVTSPPYYNAPFDYPGLFKDYDQFLGLMSDLSRELFRVLAPGRVACLVTDDMLVDGVKYPVVSDITRLMIDAGFRYRDRIVWVKPKGYVRISRRSGLVLQHPFPMYYYPDNIQENILVFQKGKFDYSQLKKLSSKDLNRSRIPLDEYNSRDWYLTVWNITNVLPLGNRLEKGVAAFPDEIARRLITLYSFSGETVLDPFLGSGTTLKVAKELGRNGLGYEIDRTLSKMIKQKLSLNGNGVVKVTQENKRKRMKRLSRHKRLPKMSSRT